MEVATGAAANVTAEVAKGIFQEAKRYIRYVIFYKKKVELFEEKLQTLIAKRTSVEEEVDVAKRNVQKIKADVEEWCHRVDEKIDQQLKTVGVLEFKAKNKCFIHLCPPIQSRYRLSKEAEEAVKAFQDLINEECRLSRPVGFLDVPEDNVDEPAKDFEAFESRQKVFNDIMEAVKDPRISMIGVHGMGGVGKSTLLKEVVRQVKTEKLFDWVVMVAVTENPIILTIQDQIAELLGLELKEKTVHTRALRLRQRFKEEKKILLVLDDLWAKLDFNEVGLIPFGDRDAQKRCKILLASRSQNVLLEFEEMDAQNTFPIDVLDDKEASNLFMKIVGENISPELQIEGNEIAARCGGLPVAISTVARTLRNKSISAWRSARKQLENPSSGGLKDISAAVYTALKLSYDHIEGEKVKRFFLFCSMLPHDALIQDVLKYSIGLGLLLGDYRVEDARDRLLTWVSHLKASGLLMDSYNNNDCFDMHDIICNVAMSIASMENNNVLVLKQEDVLKEWPKAETMKQCGWIKLRVDSNTVLPDEVECPQLTFLHIVGEDRSTKVPPDFFKKMKMLKVLDLTDMDLSSFPSSIGLLSSLQTLCLDESSLGDITVVGQLKALEILSLWNSDIEKLPKEIGELVELRLLDLRGCTKLNIIQPGILSRLTKLEELYMGEGFSQWDGDANASLNELSSLSHLTTLEVHISDAKMVLGNISFFQKLERYKIFIGEVWNWFGDYEYSKTLKLQLNTSIHHLHHAIKMLFERTEDLYLDGLKGVKIALDEFKDDGGFPHLKNLHIQNGLEIQYIIDDDEVAERNDFRELRSLTLEGLPKLISFCFGDERGSTSNTQHQCLTLFGVKVVLPCLEKLRISSINVERIWGDKISYCSQNLTKLIIKGCDKLNHLLSASMARSLTRLKYFKVVGCKSLTEIISMEDAEINGDKASILFPQLNTLKMRDLQHLKGFCSENYNNIDFVCLELLKIENCPKLKGFIYNSAVEDNHSQALFNKDNHSQALFNKEVKFPRLEKLTISHLENIKMIWHGQDQLSTNSFSQLEELVVKDCDELLTIFPPNMSRIFKGLKTLTISNCVSLEAVFVFQRLSSVEETTQVVATQLNNLELTNLPTLKQIWREDPQGLCTYENLSEVYVTDCQSLKNVFPASVATNLPQLKLLVIIRCGVEEIVANDEGTMEIAAISFKFDQLSFIMFWTLQNLKCFYPGKHTIRWRSLKTLNTYHCPKLKVLGTQLLNQPDSNEDEPTFQQPLFLVEKVIGKLEDVTLNSDDITMISESKISRSHFQQIKSVGLVSYSGESAVFPLSFLEGFSSLQKLEAFDCAFNDELFAHHCEENAVILPQIKTLCLILLNNLERIWKQDSRVERILPNLETLQLESCEKLITLGLGSSASFRNLDSLEVDRCKVMVNLVPFSALQSLVQLKKLRIAECDSMKEIVGVDEDDEATHEIVVTFSRLKRVELEHLPNLRSFCSGKYTFKLPYLEDFIVSQCPELEVFCEGAIDVPRLGRLQVGEEDSRRDWDGDLNKTLRKLYEEKDRQNLRCLFTSSMAQCFLQLQNLEIDDCRNLEEVIILAKEDMMTQVFPKLESLLLKDLSKLKRFGRGNHFKSSSLKTLRIEGCPLFKTFISDSIIGNETHFIGQEAEENNSEIDFPPLFNEKVALPMLNDLTIRYIENLKRIWDDQQAADSFCNLEDLRVQECENLWSIFPFNMSGKLQKLKRLEILKCDSLEVIFEHQGTNSDMIETIPMFEFPQLTYLQLYRLPNLKGFYHKMHTTKWPSLEKVWVYECDNMEIMFASENQNFQDRHGEETELEIQIHHPLFFTNKDTFPCLEELRLDWNDIWSRQVPADDTSLPSDKLQRLWHNQLPEMSCCFLNLKKLKVGSCRFLNYVFPLPVAENFVHLESLSISDCENVKEVIVMSKFVEEGRIIKVFPRLQKMQLRCLPKLVRFCYGDYIEFPNLRKLLMWSCPEFTTFISNVAIGDEPQVDPNVGRKNSEVDVLCLFNDKVAFPNLQKLQLKANSKWKNIWHDKLTPYSFCELNFLELDLCHGLSSVFPFSMVDRLGKLENMEISRCFDLESIIEPCGLNSSESSTKFVFPKISYLRVDFLIELKSFYPRMHTAEWPSLKKLRVINCSNIVRVFAPENLNSQLDIPAKQHLFPFSMTKV
ncbi:Disease resistance protein [Corchorus olitorius]|uniref:Disease resistance protein n=1 Tax=Corchorus olitorius TaxID=93759 RepID=A0A1R3JVV5_9ROSI|nr:Disease resistance protein [Corchorus olitorius]